MSSFWNPSMVLWCGQTVQIVGLKSKTEWNGRTGTVCGYDHASKRHIVRIREEGAVCSREKQYAYNPRRVVRMGGYKEAKVRRINLRAVSSPWRQLHSVYIAECDQPPNRTSITIVHRIVHLAVKQSKRRRMRPRKVRHEIRHQNCLQISLV